MLFSCKEFIRKLKLTMEHKLPSPLTSAIVNELVKNYVLTAALYDKCSRYVGTLPVCTVYVKGNGSCRQATKMSAG